MALFFITPSELKPPIITYEQYCVELIIGGVIKSWTLEEDNGFSAELQNQTIKEKLLASLNFFTLTPFCYFENGHLYCQYIFPYITQRPIILKYTLPLPENFTHQLPEESPDQLHKRLKKWLHYYRDKHFQLGQKLLQWHLYKEAKKHFKYATP